MRRIEKNLDRVLDANFNRAKEGLRVCEDVCRFFLNQPRSTARYKSLRHRLTDVLGSLKIRELLKSRDIEGDVGRVNLPREMRRRDMEDIFFANSQRVKESLRVLEEFLKIKNVRWAGSLKELRYEAYDLEKTVAAKFKAVSRS